MRISTLANPAMFPFRNLVNISPIGSDKLMRATQLLFNGRQVSNSRRLAGMPCSCWAFVIFRSPTCLDHSGNLAHGGQLSEAYPAKLKLPHVRPTPAATAAPGIFSHLKLRRAPGFDDLGRLGQALHPPSGYLPPANGIPNRRRRSRASSSVFAVVTMVTFIP